MEKIYIIKTIYYEYVENVKKDYCRETILYAVSDIESAKKDIKRYKERDKKERTEWFKEHKYGILPSEYKIEEVNLY